MSRPPKPVIVSKKPIGSGFECTRHRAAGRPGGRRALLRAPPRVHPFRGPDPSTCRKRRTKVDEVVNGDFRGLGAHRRFQIMPRGPGQQVAGGIFHVTPEEFAARTSFATIEIAGSFCPSSLIWPRRVG